MERQKGVRSGSPPACSALYLMLVYSRPTSLLLCSAASLRDASVKLRHCVTGQLLPLAQGLYMVLDRQVDELVLGLCLNQPGPLGPHLNITHNQKLVNETYLEIFLAGTGKDF